jgi:hypothetical protein
MPSNANEDPIRENERMDRADPTLDISNTERDAPRSPTPKMLNVAPSRANRLSDIELPTTMTSNTDMLEPTRAQLRKDSVEPM